MHESKATRRAKENMAMMLHWNCLSILFLRRWMPREHSDAIALHTTYNNMHVVQGVTRQAWRRSWKIFVCFLPNAVMVMLKRSILHNLARLPTIEVCLLCFAKRHDSLLRPEDKHFRCRRQCMRETRPSRILSTAALSIDTFPFLFIR